MLFTNAHCERPHWEPDGRKVQVRFCEGGASSANARCTATYKLLESRGFKVNLVNSRAVKNVSGRNSDVLDCQWLQQLMSYGLLSAAFRPAEAICSLRAISRQRDMLVQYQGRHVQHIYKALT